MANQQLPPSETELAERMRLVKADIERRFRLRDLQKRRVAELRAPTGSTGEGPILELKAEIESRRRDWLRRRIAALRSPTENTGEGQIPGMKVEIDRLVKRKRDLEKEIGELERVRDSAKRRRDLVLGDEIVEEKKEVESAASAKELIEQLSRAKEEFDVSCKKQKSETAQLVKMLGELSDSLVAFAAKTDAIVKASGFAG